VPRSCLVRAGTVAVYVLFLSAYGLTQSELYRNEGLRALVAAEMLRSGDWLVPTLHGEPHLTKPPGAYAAVAAVSAPLGGVTDWSARLPSCLAALAAALTVFGTFRHALGPRGGLVAAGILPVSLLWLDRAPSAEIDMLQLAWVTGALACLLRALEAAEAGDDRAQWAWWPAALACVAGGVLTKWTAPAFFYLTVAPLLGRRGRLRLLVGRHHLVSAAAAVLVCLAWAGAVAAAVGWEALSDAVRREALLRLSPAHHPRPYPWGELAGFPLTFLAACLPWSAVALLSLRPGFASLWDGRGRRLLELLHCWLWPNLLLWAVLPGHRPRHCLPLQPAVAGLAAMVWLAWLDGRLPWPVRRVTPRQALAGLLGLWLAAKLVHVHAIVPARARGTDLRAKAAAVADRVPAGEPLYLFRLKDEGLLFYCGRPTRRLADPSLLPPGPALCTLTADEWQQWTGPPAEELLALTDGQGAPVALVRVR
jgi:4-amino-4-deoxy-L-arabinose transferase-like glycosyltransferase